MLIKSDKLMEYYGYKLTGDAEKDKRIHKSFQAFKSRHKAMFPPPITRGMWSQSDVEKHLQEKPWLSPSPKHVPRLRRNRGATEFRLA